jgi:hypothetical protein
MLPGAISSVKECERKRNLCTFGTNVPLVPYRDFILGFNWENIVGWDNLIPSVCDRVCKSRNIIFLLLIFSNADSIASKISSSICSDI